MSFFFLKMETKEQKVEQKPWWQQCFDFYFERRGVFDNKSMQAYTLCITETMLVLSYISLVVKSSFEEVNLFPHVPEFTLGYILSVISLVCLIINKEDQLLEIVSYTAALWWLFVVVVWFNQYTALGVLHCSLILQNVNPTKLLQVQNQIYENYKKKLH